MGGELWFQSRLAKGTAFWIKLPLRLNPMGGGEVPVAANPAIQQLRVLVLGQAREWAGMNRLRHWLGNRLECLTIIDWQRGDELADAPYDVIVVPAVVAHHDAFSRWRTRARGQPLWLVLRDHAQPPWPRGVQVLDPEDSAALYRVLHAKALWEYAPEERASGVVAPVTRWRILVAEDNPPHQLIMRFVLEQAGHQVEMVGDGQAALERLQTAHYDIAICDAQMPKLGGLEVLHCYHAKRAGKRVPIIIASADAAPEAASKCQAAGATRYLTKPLKPERLLWAIAQTLGEIRENPATRSVSDDDARQAEAPRQGHPDPQHAPVLNVAYLEGLLTVGDAEFLDALKASFIHSSARYLEDLEQAACRGDPPAYRFNLHALLNAACAIRAEALEATCVVVKTAVAQEGLEAGDLAAIRAARTAAVAALQAGCRTPAVLPSTSPQAHPLAAFLEDVKPVEAVERGDDVMGHGDTPPQAALECADAVPGGDDFLSQLQGSPPFHRGLGRQGLVSRRL
jgi:CheY-like chemotaxis protein